MGYAEPGDRLEGLGVAAMKPLVVGAGETGKDLLAHVGQVAHVKMQRRRGPLPGQHRQGRPTVIADKHRRQISEVAVTVWAFVPTGACRIIVAAGR